MSGTSASPFTDPVPVAGSAQNTKLSPFTDEVKIPSTGHGFDTAISPFVDEPEDTEDAKPKVKGDVTGPQRRATKVKTDQAFGEVDTTDDIA